MSDQSPALRAERVLNGRYRLGRLIAHGGMAEVWHATDDVLGRAVAVKVLHTHLAVDAMFLERFRREAVAAARLAHPNVVATYDTGVDDGVAFIVMELVDGKTLRQLVVEQGPFEPRRAVDLGAQVADALDYAHRSGIVHRDVKPANILVCDDGRVKVADFGIAKAVEDAGPGRSHPAEALTMTGSIIGTAQYLSPEQVEGLPLDGRADVYALGVVLYEMLVGRPPFSGDTELAVALQHVNATPAPLRQVRPGVPPALEAVVLRAIAKSPTDRYQSAAVLQRALLEADMAAGDPTSVIAGPDHTSLDLQRPDAYRRASSPPPPAPAPSPSAPGGRRWLVPALVTAIVVVSLAVVGVIFAQSDTGRKLLDSKAADGQPVTGGQPLAVSSVAAFDPSPGDQHEHDGDLPLLVDGNPGTVWSTEQYLDSHLVALKPGVGVVLQLAGVRTLGKLKVTTPTSGWAVQAMVAASPRATLAEWGPPVATKRGIGAGTTTLDLGGRSGGAVLVWITDLGDVNSSVSIGELQVTPS